MLVFVSGKSRRLGVACVSDYTTEASHSPEKQVDPALTAAGGTGVVNVKLSTAVLVGAGHVSLQETSVGAAQLGCQFLC